MVDLRRLVRMILPTGTHGSVTTSAELPQDTNNQQAGQTNMTDSSTFDLQNESRPDVILYMRDPNDVFVVDDYVIQGAGIRVPRLEANALKVLADANGITLLEKDVNDD